MLFRSHAAAAPGYAEHVDIHNKPGYDPCELLSGWLPFNIRLAPDAIQGSHGTVSPQRRIAWATTLPLKKQPDNLLELAVALKRQFDRLD